MTVTTASGEKKHQGRKQYFGKYRGTVVQNVDPKGTGRIQVNVIGVHTIASSWAMPCFPVAGLQTGMVAVPPIGAGVWVEFEHGDPDFPIWTGCYYSTRLEVPPMAQLAPPPIPAMTLQTSPITSLQVSEAPPTPVTGGIVLKSGPSAIVVNSSGVYITCGAASITLLPAGIVTVNMGALIVK